MTPRKLLPILAIGVTAVYAAGGPGVFESAGDVGPAPQKGAVEFSAETGEYRVTGGGDVWGTADGFYYVWKKVQGDAALTADIRFAGSGAMAHRKAALMIRQSLDPDSAYADAVVHGDGLTSLQFRPAAGAMSQELREEAKSDLTAPMRLRIERRGDRITVLAGKHEGALASTAPAMLILHDPVYIGLAVSSHNPEVLESALFSSVNLQTLQATRPLQRYHSSICVYDLKEKSTRVVYEEDQIYEAPNWSSDGKYLLANSGGRLYRIAADGSGKPEAIDIDTSLRLNNDHGPSPDGRMLAFSATSPASRRSQVYLANADGSGAHLMVAASPSYFHGWSPDGKYLSYVLQHPAANGAPANYDIFRVPAAGGEPEQLDSNPGYDDGPDYSPNGKWIYFNSDRSGKWEIWRIPSNGAGPNDEKAEQVTKDDRENWFPHPSPDGKRLLLLSFPKGTETHNDKLAGTQLRIMPAPGASPGDPPAIDVLTTFFGGQGTINVNSWAPDSARFAYVVYAPLPPAGGGK
jgi:TolB protein